jgi:hypothetical protein
MQNSTRTIVVLLMLTFVLEVMTQHQAYAAPNDNDRIWRARIILKTGDVNGAGTDDSVMVKLNDRNFTWLDYGRDDFERAARDPYDLELGGVCCFSEITMIRIAKPGTDAWCLQGFTLEVNGRRVFNQDNLSPDPPACQWIGNGGPPSITISFAELRASPEWQAYSQPDAISRISATTCGIPREEMESRIEAHVGHLLHGRSLKWGHISGRGAVEVSQRSRTAVKVDLDLEYKSWWFNPEVDVDFDLSLDAGFRPIVSNLNVKVDSDWYSELLSLGIVEIFDRHYWEVAISDALSKALPSGEPGFGYFVTGNGDIIFGGCLQPDPCNACPIIPPPRPLCPTGRRCCETDPGQNRCRLCIPRNASCP